MKVIYNRDKELAEEAKRAVKANGGYCPCQLLKDSESKCMCADFREKIKNGYIGECNCGLYEAIPSD